MSVCVDDSRSNQLLTSLRLESTELRQSDLFLPEKQKKTNLAYVTEGVRLLAVRNSVGELSLSSEWFSKPESI